MTGTRKLTGSWRQPAASTSCCGSAAGSRTGGASVDGADRPGRAARLVRGGRRRPGRSGKFVLRWLNSDDCGNRAEMHATITRLDPLRLLETTGDLHGVRRWELQPDRSGTDTPALRVTARPDQPVLVSEDHRLDAVAQSELRQDPPDVRLDRRLGDEKAARDLAVRQTLSDVREHLVLALGEAGQFRRPRYGPR